MIIGSLFGILVTSPNCTHRIGLLKVNNRMQLTSRDRNKCKHIEIELLYQDRPRAAGVSARPYASSVSLQSRPMRPS